MSAISFEWDEKKSASNKKKLRIISARKAMRPEQKPYWERWSK